MGNQEFSLMIVTGNSCNLKKSKIPENLSVNTYFQKLTNEFGKSSEVDKIHSIWLLTNTSLCVWYKEAFKNNIKSQYMDITGKSNNGFNTGYLLYPNLYEILLEFSKENAGSGTTGYEPATDLVNLYPTLRSVIPFDNEKDCKNWLEFIVNTLNVNYHPDDEFENYLENGRLTDINGTSLVINNSTKDWIDNITGNAMAICGDKLYEYGFEIMKNRLTNVNDLTVEGATLDEILNRVNIIDAEVELTTSKFSGNMGFTTQQQNAFDTVQSFFNFLVRLYSDNDEFQEYMDNNYPFQCSLDEVFDILNDVTLDPYMFGNVFNKSDDELQIEFFNIVDKTVIALNFILDNPNMTKILSNIMEDGFKGLEYSNIVAVQKTKDWVNNYIYMFKFDGTNNIGIESKTTDGIVDDIVNILLKMQNTLKQDNVNIVFDADEVYEYLFTDAFESAMYLEKAVPDVYYGDEETKKAYANFILSKLPVTEVNKPTPNSSFTVDHFIKGDEVYLVGGDGEPIGKVEKKGPVNIQVWLYNDGKYVYKKPTELYLEKEWHLFNTKVETVESTVFDSGQKSDIIYFVEKNSWFEFENEEDGGEILQFATRQNGNVGNEEYGEKDANEGRNITGLLLKKYGEDFINVEMEFVDEYVYIRVIKKTKQNSVDVTNKTSNNKPSIATLPSRTLKVPKALYDELESDSNVEMINPYMDGYLVNLKNPLIRNNNLNYEIFDKADSNSPYLVTIGYSTTNTTVSSEEIDFAISKVLSAFAFFGNMYDNDDSFAEFMDNIYQFKFSFDEIYISNDYSFNLFSGEINKISYNVDDSDNSEVIKTVLNSLVDYFNFLKTNSKENNDFEYYFNDKIDDKIVTGSNSDSYNIVGNFIDNLVDYFREEKNIDNLLDVDLTNLNESTKQKTYKEGEIVRIKPEFCNTKEEAKIDFEVVEDRDTRILVKIAGDNKRFAPTEAFFKYMLVGEKNLNESTVPTPVRKHKKNNEQKVVTKKVNQEINIVGDYKQDVKF